MTLAERDKRSRRFRDREITRKKMDQFRDSCLVDDVDYQTLRLRRRLLQDCHIDLLLRGVHYFDEMEELAGHLSRRGLVKAELMTHEQFRAAVAWADSHPESRLEGRSAEPTEQESATIDEGYETDSGAGG